VQRARQPIPALMGGFTAPGENGPLYTLMLHYWLRLIDAFPFLGTLLHWSLGRALKRRFGVCLCSSALRLYR
jgi:hypothetical protein